MKTPAISSTFILSLAAVAGLVIAHGSLAVRSVRAQGALGSPLPGLSSGQLAHFTTGIGLFDGSLGPLQGPPGWRMALNSGRRRATSSARRRCGGCRSGPCICTTGGGRA